MHSADGLSNWSYIGGDRRPFFGRGPTGGDPYDNPNHVPSPTDPRTWRESMVTIVGNGFVVRGNETIQVFAWGNRDTHAGRETRADGKGGGSRIVRLPMRRDGFASIGAESSSWLRPARFRTKAFIFTGSKLLLNAKSTNGGSIRVSVFHSQNDGATKVLDGYSLDACVPISGNVFSAAVEWRVNGFNLSSAQGKPIALEFELRGSAEIFSFRFDC